MSMSELSSLLELLQDRDSRTLEIVRSRLYELGWPAIAYCIRNVGRGIPLRERDRVRRIVCDTSSVYAVRQLEELLKEESGTLYLPEALYFLTRIMDPELTPERFDSYFEPMGNELMCELRDTMTAVEKVEMLNYLFFERFGFALNSTEPDGYETVVLIPDVIEERKAGVVGISMVYFLLAGYAGLPVYPIFPKMPGYYVAYFDRGESLFSMDMTCRGRISDPVPRRHWRNPEKTGKDSTILYLYAAAMRYFGMDAPSCLEERLLDQVLDRVKI